jgi:hypothetical protein
MPKDVTLHIRILSGATMLHDQPVTFCFFIRMERDPQTMCASFSQKRTKLYFQVWISSPNAQYDTWKIAHPSTAAAWAAAFKSEKHMS